MRAITVAIGIVALAAPLLARANAGVGLLVLAIPVTVVALPPAILLEAPVLARFLRLSWPRGLWVSLVANVVSTIAGAAIALATSFVPVMYGEFMRETALISLVPMFLLTWWLERLVVGRMAPAGTKPLATRATGAANAFTYALMAIGVTLLVPPAGEKFDRWRLSPVLAQLSVARAEVAEYFDAHATFPPPRDIKPLDASVKSVALEPGGRLVATLSFPGRPAGDGRHIVYEPVVAAGKVSAWKCSSPDLAPQYLPPACR